MNYLVQPGQRLVRQHSCGVQYSTAPARALYLCSYCGFPDLHIWEYLGENSLSGMTVSFCHCSKLIQLSWFQTSSNAVYAVYKKAIDQCLLHWSRIRFQDTYCILHITIVYTDTFLWMSGALCLLICCSSAWTVFRKSLPKTDRQFLLLTIFYNIVGWSGCYLLFGRSCL